MKTKAVRLYGETDERFKNLDALVKKNNGIWSAEAETYLLNNF